MIQQEADLADEKLMIALPGSEEERPSWDREFALEQAGNDPELLSELIGIFLEDAGRLVSEMRAGIDCGDARKIEMSAHSLKGSVSNFGAVRVRDLAFELEKQGRSNHLGNARETLVSLETVYKILAREMREYVG